jgi:hypothetical protein
MNHSLCYLKFVDALNRKNGMFYSDASHDAVLELASLHARDDVSVERRFGARDAFMTDEQARKYAHWAVGTVMAELRHCGVQIWDHDTFQVWWREGYVAAYRDVRDQVASSIPYVIEIDSEPEGIEEVGISVKRGPLDRILLQLPVGTVKQPTISVLQYTDWMLVEHEDTTYYMLPSGQTCWCRAVEEYDPQEGAPQSSSVFGLDPIGGVV